jgi:UDP-GlcNAc:undecaprenyl-phosphate/decaprenyl-phosphate GlcNAc-1-phosphate transferase
VLVLIALTLSMSLCCLLSMRVVAFRYGLVDKPTKRKQHQGDIPFIGGVALFFTVLIMAVFYPNYIPNQNAYLLCSGLLIVLGTLDDKFELSAIFRLIVLSLISVWLNYSQGVSLHSLGNLLGHGDITITTGSAVLTAMAIIGCVSAYNMIDGMDGLLGALSCLAFTALGYLFYHAGEIALSAFCGLLVVALLPYLLCNLDVIPRRSVKVFIGDAGTFFIGFTIIWLLIYGSQPSGISSHMNTNPIIRSSTALWIIALPLMDMAMVMIRRMRKKQSPFKADRLHLHYICQRLGLSQRATLTLLVTIASLCAAFGVWGQLNEIPNYVMFYLFLATFAVYMTIISHIWKVCVTVRQYISPKNRLSDSFKSR